MFYWLAKNDSLGLTEIKCFFLLLTEFLRFYRPEKLFLLVFLMSAGFFFYSDPIRTRFWIWFYCFFLLMFFKFKKHSKKHLKKFRFSGNPKLHMFNNFISFISFVPFGFVFPFCRNKLQLQPGFWNNKTAKASSPQNIFDIWWNKKF